MDDTSANAAEVPADPAGVSARRRLSTHAIFGTAIVLCAAAFWIELTRALRGNGLSWAYVFEWPLLAGFVVYMWRHQLRQPGGEGRQTRPPAPDEVAPEYRGMLEAWQAHQRDLAARQHEEPPPRTS